MEIRTLVLGSYAVNCYLVSGATGRCVIIDPGYDAKRILSVLEKEGWTADAILLTHRHFDHVGAVDALVKALSCPVYLHPLDRDVNVPILFGRVGATYPCCEGDILALAGLTFTVLHTPGHTPGSVCLLCENALFTGDTLFALSCGRTDFPGSSPRDMRDSLRRLAALEENYTVCPGHGEASTLQEEKNCNPYLYN